jgi:iron complex outermembrane receptor protein
MQLSAAFNLIPERFRPTDPEKRSQAPSRAGMSSAPASRAGRLSAGMILLACLAVPLGAPAQEPATPSDQSKPAAVPGRLPPVITTVVVKGQMEDVYQPGNVTLGGFVELPLAESPQSALVVTRSVLDDQQARILSDVTKNDASIGDDYAPVGYYQDFQIRGFPIDLATGVKINGLTVAGEQLVSLENKESVEFLNGLAGSEAGVASPGGLINYVTKRPAIVRSLNLATDQRGTIFGHVDLGGFLGSHKQLGLRTNVGAESMRSYVNDADGTREFAALAGDWKIGPKTFFQGDFEYQHLVQRSVAGYQLLSGTTVPSDVYPSTMLGEQWWAKPNTFDVFNTSIRLDRTFTQNWRAYVSAGMSRSLIDDNIAWPYGCYYEAACNTGKSPEPWFFSPTGDYDVYDYRSPGELRIDDQFEAIVLGNLKTGPIKHNVLAGTSLLRRSVSLPAAVDDYVGTDNVYQPLKPFQPSPNSPGPVTLQEDSHQYGVVIQDRIEMPGRITISAGGQIDTLHDHNYSQTDPVTLAVYLDKTNKTLWLPQYSVAYRPLGSLTLYANYSVALSLGLQAPFWAINSSEFLSPFFTRQVEIGAKYEANKRLLVTTSVYRMRAPFFYPKPVDGGLEFVSEGHETHRGIEFSAQGAVSSWLHLTASTAAIMAISDETGTPVFDNKQVLNQPHFRATLSADVVVPYVPGLGIMPGWGYTGRKAATRDDLVSVGGYNVFNLGLRYTPRGEMSRVTFRLYADNITNKRYWKDTGANYGDTFLYLGAPATVRLSTQFTF